MDICSHRSRFDCNLMGRTGKKTESRKRAIKYFHCGVSTSIMGTNEAMKTDLNTGYDVLCAMTHSKQRLAREDIIIHQHAEAGILVGTYSATGP